MGTLTRTALRVNQAGQGLFRVITTLGETAYRTAVLLTENDFDITRAALVFGLERKCEGCERPVQQEALRGCNRCVATIRQRVHRMQERISDVLGAATPVTRHRRPVLIFGADRQIDERPTLYERSASAEGPEGVEL